MSKKQKMIIGLIILVAVVGVGLSAYLYMQVKDLKESPQVVAQKEATSLVAKVSKLVLLPEGETPTIATVSDTEALKDQAFFKDAKKGDKVLIYTQAKKAVLYSVTLNKVIDVAPLNIGNSGGTSTKEIQESTSEDN